MANPHPGKRGEIVYIDPSAASWTILFPNPATGLVNNDRFSVATRDLDIDLITLDGNGNTIEGYSTIQMAAPQMVMEFVWAADVNTWVLIGGTPPPTPLLSYDGQLWNPGSLGAAYQTVNVWQAPIRQLVGTVATGFLFWLPGIYQMSFTLGMDHNSSNQGRQFNVRLYNATDAFVIGQSTVSTGRNAEGTNYSFTLVLDVPLGSVGDTIEVQLGGGDTYSNVEIDSLLLTLVGLDNSLLAQATP